MKRALIVLAAWLLSLSIYAQNCPALECIQGFVVTLHYNADVDSCVGIANAQDFIASDLFSCPTPLSFAIYHQTDVVGGDFVPDFNGDHSDIIVGETNFNELINVVVYLRDGDGNIQSCTTYMHIEANFGECGNYEESLSGIIITENREAINGANVEIIFSEDTLITTTQDGAYPLVYPLDSIFYITPTKEDNPLNGISTFDIVLMSKHILGIDLLDSPYKMIAADVNNSETISTLDLIHIRRLILGIYTEFPDNSSWRFIPEDYEFPDPLNPWSEEFPEAIFINSSPQETINFNFIGIKTGDVSGNASGY